MTTATGTDQDTTLYGPDGRPLPRPATPPAARAPRPSVTSGDWRPVTTKGNATTWEKTPPEPTAPPADTTPRADLDASRAQIAELEKHLAIEAAKDHHPTTTPDPVPVSPRPAVAPAPTTEKQGWFDRHGPNIAMWAAVGLSASGEYALAIQAHFPMLVAALLPVAMDVYVIQAMRRRRDVAAALILAVAANTLDRLAAAHIIGVDETTANGHPVYTASWWLIVAVVSIAPFIVWRVHRITETKKRRSRSRDTSPAETTVPRETETRETTETTVSVSTVETAPETTVETARETETKPRETTVETETETETWSPQAETRETTRPETTGETRSPRPARARAPRETTTHTVTSIGDRETETNALLDLMKVRGGPDKVSLKDAIAETGRPKATAAKRLAAARDLYAQSA